MLDIPDEKIAVTGQVLMLIHDSSRLYEENAKLRELVDAYDSTLSRLCDQSLNAADCEGCVLGCGYTDDVCAMDALRRVACELGVEIQK